MSEGTKTFNPLEENNLLKQTLAELIARVEKLEKASLPMQYYPYGPLFGPSPFPLGTLQYNNKTLWPVSDVPLEGK